MVMASCCAIAGRCGLPNRADERLSPGHAEGIVEVLGDVAGGAGGGHGTQGRVETVVVEHGQGARMLLDDDRWPVSQLGHGPQGGVDVDPVGPGTVKPESFDGWEPEEGRIRNHATGTPLTR